MVISVPVSQLGGGGSTLEVTPGVTLSDSVCDGAEYKPLKGLKPAVAVDSLEMRSTMGEAPPAFRIVATEGSPCSTAVDKAACTAKYASTTPTTGWTDNSSFGGPVVTGTRYIIYTRGDEVGTLTSLDALRTFLAPFDTVKEGALLLVEGADAHRFNCSYKNAGTGPGAGDWTYLTETGVACGEGSNSYKNEMRVSSTGAETKVSSVVLEVGSGGCAIGRRPEGYACRAHDGTLANYFSEIASLEAASVPAFRRLARELRVARAPHSLLARVDSAIRDEVRHTRQMRALAAKFGAQRSARRTPSTSQTLRPLGVVAMENAVEGCVRETFGALVATYQSVHAKDPSVRETMLQIAKDETDHAMLSHDISSWAENQLSPEERRRLEEARAKAIADLRAECEAPIPVALQDAAGLPSPAVAKELLASLERNLWARSASTSPSQNAAT